MCILGVHLFCHNEIMQLVFKNYDIKCPVGDDQAEPEGRVQHVISLESLHSHQSSKSSSPS